MKYISQWECPKNTWKSVFEVNILTVTLLCTCFPVFCPSVWVVFTKLPLLFCRTMTSEEVCPKLLKTKSYHNSYQPYCLGFTQIFWGTNIIWIFSNLRVVYFLEKYDELSELVAFTQNWGILQTRMDQRGNHMKINFDYFQIQKWMLQKVSRKIRWKMGSFVKFSCFLSELWSLNCQKKDIFCSFMQTWAKNLRQLKLFIYMLVKVLISFFEEMIWFIGDWATVHEIAIKISKKMLTQQKFNKIRLQTVISSKQYGIT